MELINDKQGNILLIQQQKIKNDLKKLRLETYNAIRISIKGYL